ncbi:unnamed protein product [Trichogramma brassicae]|uniref:Uncharacterized protein n=1 Tax=Trichogramma brassicae TaxID=86971 RepID=A0A6H5IC53_9HYME|nr:unnamed protein product [Trichogramma brassicae]
MFWKLIRRTVVIICRPNSSFHFFYRFLISTYSQTIINESLPKNKTRRSWKRDDIDDFENAFNIEINQGVYPSRKKILDMMSKYPRLQKRGEGAIRAKFQNLKKRNLL